MTAFYPGSYPGVNSGRPDRSGPVFSAPPPLPEGLKSARSHACPHFLTHYARESAESAAARPAPLLASVDRNFKGSPYFFLFENGNFLPKRMTLFCKKKKNRSQNPFFSSRENFF